MEYLGNDTIEVLEPDESLDPDGSVRVQVKLDPSEATLIATIPNCSVQPFLLADKLQVEDNKDRAYASTTYRVFAPPSASIVNHTHWIRFDGVVYEVFGHPGPWRDLSGYPHHVEFLIRLRRG